MLIPKIHTWKCLSSAIILVDDLSTFTNEFTTLLNLLKARLNFIYICGDYNIDILKMSSNHAYKTFYENILLAILLKNNTSHKDF